MSFRQKIEKRIESVKDIESEDGRSGNLLSEIDFQTQPRGHRRLVSICLAVSRIEIGELSVGVQSPFPLLNINDGTTAGNLEDVEYDPPM